jgi:hypothetical protein
MGIIIDRPSSESKRQTTDRRLFHRLRRAERAVSSRIDFLRLVGAANPWASVTSPFPLRTQTVVHQMREIPICDDVVRNARLRKDGRMVHDYYQFQVKQSAQSVDDRHIQLRLAQSQLVPPDLVTDKNFPLEWRVFPSQWLYSPCDRHESTAMSRR